MRILFIGDIVGRSGRDALGKYMPELKEKLKPDAIIVNVDNAAHGHGVTADICKEIYGYGAHVLTGGNHIWDQREIIAYIDRDPKLLRAINMPKGAPGKGIYIHTTEKGQKILVIHAMARVFMPDIMDDPFAAVNDILNTYHLGGSVHAIFLDFHGEATSEKMAMAHYLDGRVSAVVGTHTHMPTADVQILNGGTAFQSDAGMTGDYDSVIGTKKDIPIARFTRKMPTDKFSPADGEGTLCGLFLETDSRTGLTLRVGAVRMGPRLKPEMPDF